MSEQKKTTPQTQDLEASPEAQAEARIKELQAAIVRLQKELRTMKGQFSNRDPRLLRTLQQENEALQKRLARLETALLGLLLDAFRPRTVEEEKQQYEILRLAAVEFCQKANVDPEIWKNLVS